jgi:hypothetical protein
MLITVKLNREFLPLIAPLGAAAYTEQVNGSTAKIIFAMMKKDESGVAAIKRVTTAYPLLSWKSVAARPEAQKPAPYPGFDLASYDFVYRDGHWSAATEAIAAIINAMASFSQMPKSPPAALAYNFGPEQAKKTRTS